MGRYAFVVAYTDNYLKGFTALKNSIQTHMPQVEIVSHHGVSVEDTAIERFNIACKAAESYDSICLMDADMFLTADCGLFFDVAANGFIVTGSNGMIVDFNLAHQKKYNIYLDTPDYPYEKVHTTAPIFISHTDIDWFKALYDTQRIDHWDDFLYLNILGILLGKDKKMICMPPYMFTGIHHWQMKPETAAIEKGNKLLSGTEEQIYMVHGKWWDDAWLSDLPLTMNKYFKDNDISAKQQRRTHGSIELLKSIWLHYYNSHDR